MRYKPRTLLSIIRDEMSSKSIFYFRCPEHLHGSSIAVHNRRAVLAADPALGTAAVIHSPVVKLAAAFLPQSLTLLICSSSSS